MTTERKDDQWLDEIWQESDVYIEDDGFTARVMEQLPPPRQTFRWRRLILVASALLAAVVGLVIVPGGAFLNDVLYQVASYRPDSAPLPIVPMAVIVLLVGGGVAAVAAAASSE